MTTAPACHCVQQQLSDLRRLNRCLENEVVGGVRALDRRRAWLQQQALRRHERCEHLAEMTRCLQNDASLMIQLQHELLRCALTRRGLRALRATTHSKPLLETLQLLPKSYGGIDYIAGLFDPRCHGNTEQRPQRPFNVDFQSSLTDVHILFVDPNGDNIRIINKSPVEKELGNHSIAQLDVNASTVSEYHLPAQLKLPPLGVTTLWAALSTRAINCPPTDLICATVPLWITTNDYSIVLRRPDKQAMAWTTTGRVKPMDRSRQEAEAAAAAAEDEDVFWSVSRMMLRAAATSQRDDDTDVNSSELSNRVSVRVPASSSTGRSESALFPCLYADRRHDNRSRFGPSQLSHSLASTSCRPAAVARARRLPPIPELVTAGAPASRMGSASLRQPVVKSSVRPCNLPFN